MRKILLLGMLLGASPPVIAQTNVYETAKGSGTISNIVSLSTYVTTQVDSAHRKLTERFIIEVWNDDASYDIFCGFSVNTSSLTANANFGRRIPPRSSKTWAIPISVPVYCISGAPNVAGGQIVMTQLW